jgi:hypothetical protein
MNEQLARLLRYDVWANQETLSSLEQDEIPLRSLRWMGHIIGAEFLWLARIQGVTSPIGVWPDLSVEQCAARLPELTGALTDFDVGR